MIPIDIQVSRSKVKVKGYRISGNFSVMEILALLADDKNTPN